MSWPVCSADADEAYAQADHPPAPEHHETCDGWAGTDPEGRPRPCLTCRPQLRRRVRPGPPARFNRRRASR